jgi:hypothetical protein
MTTATEIVARWQHMDGALTDPLWNPNAPTYVMLREFWQAAKLGATAELDYSGACIMLDELRRRLHESEAKNAALRATIIEADSAFNRDGHESAWDETHCLVRLCHEGRAAKDELAACRANETWLEDAPNRRASAT